MNAVFEGLKVADFSWAAAGPLVTKYLADFGAEVVRIESSLYPDTPRLSAPYTERVPEQMREMFIEEWATQYIAQHPVDSNGNVWVDMVRLEIEAVRSSSR